MPGTEPGPRKRKRQGILHFGRRPVFWLLPAPKLLSQKCVQTSMVTLCGDHSPSKSLPMFLISGHKPGLNKVATVSSSFLGESAVKAKKPLCHREIRILRTYFCASALGRENTLIHDNTVCANVNTRASHIRREPLRSYFSLRPLLILNHVVCGNKEKPTE